MRSADPLQSIRCALLPPSLTSSSLMNSAESTLAALGSIINRSASGGNNQQTASPTLSSAKPPRSSSSGQNKILLAQISRLQTELQMQAVRHQSTIAELRRRLAYVSARQTHTPMAVERTYTIRLPLMMTADDSSDGSSELARKFGFSLLPDGTGLGGAIVTSVVSESLAYNAGLHIFDRICKVDGVNICNSMNFVQLVELLKGGSNNGNKQFLTLEIARFEEPQHGKIFGSDENQQQLSPSCSPNSIKENEEQYSPSSLNCQQCNHQQNCNKVTVASVAVQTLPCLNPWFLADVRISSTAVRTLRNGQQEKLQQSKPPLPDIPVQASSNQVVAVTSEVVTAKPPISGPVSCPAIDISIPNFVPPANLNVPQRPSNQETPKWPVRSASNDSAISINAPNIEEPTTMSSEKTWRTSSSSTTISLSTSQSADHKSVGSGRSFSSGGNKPSPSDEQSSTSAQDTPPEKPGAVVVPVNNDNQQVPVENFQRPVTMYTNSQHLAHTIRIQQHLFLQAQSSKSKLNNEDNEGDVLASTEDHQSSKIGDKSQQQEPEEHLKRRLSSLSYVSCTSSPMTSSSNRHLPNQAQDDVLSWNDGSSNGGGCKSSSADAGSGYRWVIKVKSDGTRRIVRRPVKNQAEILSSSVNNDYFEEKTSNNSTPADESRNHRHRNHHRRHEKQEVNQVEEDGKQSSSRKEKSDGHHHHHHRHHSKSGGHKHRPEAPVLAVTTV